MADAARYEVDGPDKVTLMVHPAHREIRLIPEYALPSGKETLAASFISTLGGAFLGLGLGALTQGGSDPVVIRALAEKCIASEAACTKLQQRGAVLWPYLAVGLACLLLHGLMQWSRAQKAQDAKSQAAAPKSAA